MKKVNVLIVGTGSLLNYGCEAIVQGAYRIIKAAIPESEIYVASDDIGYDQTVLPHDVQLISYKQRFTPYRIYKGILRRFFHIGGGSAVRMNTHVGEKFDIVLSCGGDNYCEAPNGTIYTILEDLMEIGHRAFKKGKKYVLWGASVGPFITEINRRKVADNLKECSLITVREKLSYEYTLSELGCSSEKVKLIADPAFCMEPDEDVDFKKESSFTYIGLNISQLAISHACYGEEVEEIQNRLFKQLDDYLAAHELVRYLCIPHVMTDPGPQDDVVFMQKYIDFSNFKNRIDILPARLGSRKTKAIISKMDLLIAARMHCCVGGVSSSTPTLFITYSNKGIGMSCYTYGHHRYETTVKGMLEPQFIETIDDMLAHRKEIKEYLKAQQSRFLSEANEAGHHLAMILNNN